MFKFLFKQNQGDSAKPAETETAAIAPGTNIRYDANLVAELKSDHGDLVELFTDIVTSSGQRDSNMLTKQLAKFGSMLRGHILKENVRFYVYLKSSLQSDESSLSIMHEFSNEMQQIGRAVTDFLHKYTAVAHWDDAQWAVFQRDLNAVGEVLTKRIETEENTLYPLYMPPGSYS
ncbi:MAG: hemerythrin domain-containing protein [Gallionellaceae bacterium]|nr:hemerythrin domain-containing protein [Gallionellaceae bacterium]